MDRQALPFVEIVNKLKRATLEGKLLWERAGTHGHQHSTVLDNGYRATIAPVPSGQSVVLTMVNGQGAATLHLDSSRVADDVLKLALLQLFVAVRDTVARQVADDLLNAVKDL